MKRLDIVTAKLKKLYGVLFDSKNFTGSDKISSEDIENIKNEIRKYEAEKKTLYLKESNRFLKEMPWLMGNETYKKILTNNAEFNCLFLELLHKCPNMVNDMEILMPIVNFINGNMNKIARLREVLSFNRNVLNDAKLLRRINDNCYPQIKEILKSITLMSNPRFREYLANSYILNERTYDNVRLMERAFKEGLNWDFVLALGSYRHAKDYFRMNMSKELLDHIASAKTKTLKKQILSIMYDCQNEKILNILARYFEIGVIREQLLDENSFYYKLLINPLYEGVSHREYASIESIDINQEFTDMKVSKELFEQVANSNTKTLKKQMLKLIFNCKDEEILNILVGFFEIDEVREQLLDENSFYYNLLIKPIKKGTNVAKYASLDEILSSCSKRFDNYILACDNTDMLAHSFDCITDGYIYYYKDGSLHQAPVKDFTKSFNEAIVKFYKVLELINSVPAGKDQDFLSQKYEKYLNDDLREVAKMAILDNQDKKLSKEELTEWNEYIDVTYESNNNIHDDNFVVVIGYGFDSFDESERKNSNYSYCWTITPQRTVFK